MYKRIVEAKARRAFAQLNRRRPEKMVKQFAGRFSYHFVGDHSLGGTRTTRPGMVRWFERVFTVFPATQFTVHDVLVRGWPWRTRVAVFATLDATVNGEPYTNDFIQRIDLRWGRVTHITTMEDNQRCAAALQRAAAGGIAEAAAPPIMDSASGG